MKKIRKTGIEYMYDLYRATSQKKFKKVVICPELYPYAKRVYLAYGNSEDLINVSGELIPNIKEKRDIRVFAVSGGKDSFATYLKYRKKNKNRNRLFYVADINPLYPSEKIILKKIYSLFGEKVKFLNFNLKEVHLWLPESVIKNQMIYSLIMEYADFLPSEIGFGGTKNIGPQSMAFFHDHPLSFSLFHKFAKKSWGNHKILEFIYDEIEAYKIIFKNLPQKEVNLGSCMSRYELKSFLRKKLKKEFNIVPQDKYSCGMCYKCVERELIEHNYFKKPLNKRYLLFCKKVILDKINEALELNGFPQECLKDRYPKEYLKRMRIRVNNK